MADIAFIPHCQERVKRKMSIHNQKDHYAAIEDVHVNLENRNHAFEEYGYGPLNPRESSNDFWKQKAKIFNTTVEEAKKSRCGNCAAFNQSKEVMERIADGLGPVGEVIVGKADLGFCELFKFKCAAERTCDAWLVNGPINEGITDYLPSMDSVSAFGRNVADTATFGGYKYARAGADYVAKKALKATGLSKKDTTYSKELDQEKEKLAKDDIKHPQAAAAGDIAGMGAMAVAPEIPGVGAAIGSAMKSGETASKIPSYLNLARRAIGLEEDVPTNATGPAIPGSGDTGEVFKSMRPMARRGMFMRQETFVVSSSTFNSLREAKKKNVRWKRYLEEDDAYHDLREYARKKRKGPIIVEDERTGCCMYVRYGDFK